MFYLYCIAAWGCDLGSPFANVQISTIVTVLLVVVFAYNYEMFTTSLVAHSLSKF